MSSDRQEEEVIMQPSVGALIRREDLDAPEGHLHHQQAQQFVVAAAPAPPGPQQQFNNNNHLSVEDYDDDNKIDDDPRMRLTEAERGAAILIKNILQKHYIEDSSVDGEDDDCRHPLDPTSLPSDFMIAQFAIVSIQQGEANPNVILDRIRNLQHALEEIDIRDTYEDGIVALRQICTTIAPRYFLSFGYSQEEESYMSVIDVTKFDGNAILSSEHKCQIWLKSEYYRCQAAFNDFESVRRGLLQLVECQDYDWRSPNMLNMHCGRKLSNDLAAYYPLHFRKNKHYHTGMFFNMFIAALRRLLPNAVHNSFEVGCQFDHGRLDEFLLLPTPEESNKRLIDGLQKALQKRYQNEATFTLQ